MHRKRQKWILSHEDTKTTLKLSPELILVFFQQVVRHLFLLAFCFGALWLTFSSLWARNVSLYSWMAAGFLTESYKCRRWEFMKILQILWGLAKLAALSPPTKAEDLWGAAAEWPICTLPHHPPALFQGSPAARHTLGLTLSPILPSTGHPSRGRRADYPSLVF